MSDFPRSLKFATVWLLIGGALFLAVQWWQAEAARTRFTQQDGVVELRRGPDGHYHWPGSIGDQAVDFLVDTGATSSALPLALARELELREVGRVRTQTAGGEVTGMLVLADVSLDGGVRVQRLRMAALPGLGDKPLLGMDVLGRLHWQQRQGVLRIELQGQ
ncbi:retropepsin-like aspartic protease family protein [Azohydromonas caseinilytica]|uniref:TIGR02281 family clan AA aspartic protease n=1 Tax=Azohydromonas caseinilytica TaxID=2728836 RepID=A0A848F593_9BURK|nr:retropepsin-like aspartic protease [Azohydromonas caseinilytica]NML13816.1 TIGR02281 family clan AA aspartic protease [Azohydromonas caseinilytica]